MRVLHIVSSGGVYGKERVILELINLHNRSGLTSILGSISLPDEPTKDLDREAMRMGIDVCSFALGRGLDLCGARAILRYVAQQQVDLIHIHDYKGSILLACHKLLLRPMPPLIRTLHGFTATNKLSKMAIYEWFDRCSLRMHDLVIGVSDDMKDKLGGDLAIIKNGISPIERCQFDDNDEIARFCKDSIVIGSIARLSPEKNQLALLNALWHLHQWGIKAKLVLIGEGECRTALAQYAEKLGISGSLWMPGFLANARQYLYLFDVYAQPSLREGTPISILEAMQIGVPLCVTAVGGMEYLLKMSTGCRTSGEAGDIAQNIRYIVENANYREQIVHNAKQLFIREYSSASMAQSYEQAYCNLLTQKACPKIK